MTIIKKFEPEKEEKRKLPSVKLILAGAFLMILIVVEIWVSHSVVMQGAQVAELESLQKKIASENQILESQIATDASLANIASKSASLGLERPKDIQYIR